MGNSFYDKLPLELVAGFFYQIQQNIDKGILSDAMHQEVKLLERTAKRRGVTLEDLYEQGSRLFKLEMAKQQRTHTSALVSNSKGQGQA